MIRRAVVAAAALTLTACALTAAAAWTLTHGLRRLDDAIHLNLDVHP